MEKIIMKSLSLENFQKFKKKEINFGKEKTVIRGGNGQGKTTIYSAMTWLLFGKDYKGSTDTGRGAFDIKHRVNGERVEHADTSVEGVFLIKGEEIKLKRTLHEVWSTGDNPKYTSDVTQCYVNDVPKQVGEYSDFINSIIDEREFRMITDIKYFLSLPVQTQRDYLCSMGGVRELKDICENNEQWKKVLDEITGKSLDDFLKQLAFEKKRLKDEEFKIAPSIESLERSKPETEDKSELEKKKALLTKEIDDLSQSPEFSFDSQKQSVLARMRTEKNELNKEISRLILEKQKEQNRLDIEAQNECDRKNEERRKFEEQISELVKNRDSLLKDLNDEDRKKKHKIKIEVLKKERENLFAEYQKLQSENFNADNIGVCPLLSSHKCDSPKVMEFIENQKEKAIEAYNMAKAEKIKHIILDGKNKGSEIEELESYDVVLNEKINEIKNSIDTIVTLKDSLPVYEKKETTSPELEKLKKDIIDINGKINSKDKEIEAEEQLVMPNASKLDESRKLKQNELDKVNRELGKVEQLESIERQINGYKEQDLILNQKISELENKEFVTKEINRAQVTDAEERVNKLFSIVRWRMYELQKNGLYAEVCKPVDENGVSSSLNPGNLVNMGVDIVNAISVFKGICAPVFIDNHESVNECIPAVGQEIDLYVAESKSSPLTIQIIK